MRQNHAVRSSSSEETGALIVLEERAEGAELARRREELAWVLAQPDFARSSSLVRFLSYICEKTFDGAADEIREYAIAVDALGRKAASFDSHVDPIVRVTARSLRKKLLEIYQNEGKKRPLRIALPLGHYVPEFIDQKEDSERSPNLEEEPGDEDLLSSGSQPHKNKELPLHSALLARWPTRVALFMLAFAAVFGVGFLLGRRSEPPTATLNDTIHWGDPVWSEEFNGAAREQPNASVWGYQTGNQDGWGNHELEIYCAATGSNPKACDQNRPNSFLDGAGHLVLRAERMPDGHWTSARLTTKGLKNFEFGRLEARIKMPVGSGLWPSFWMLGANFDTVGWPAAGSVDIAENAPLNPKTNGLGPQMIRATVHGPRYFGGNGFWHDYRLPNGARVDDGSFHTYGIIWSPGMIQFYVDDPANIYFVQEASSLPEGGTWVFDKPFFLVLNLAVGGDWPRDPDRTTPNPAAMLVDYVRLYRIPPVAAPTIAWKPVRLMAGTEATSTVRLEADRLAGRVRVSCSTDAPSVRCTLGSPVVNFSDTLVQEDTLTLATDGFSDKGRTVAPAGHYKVTITATTISGDHAQRVVPFEVDGRS